MGGFTGGHPRAGVTALAAALAVVVLYAALFLPDDVSTWLLGEERPVELISFAGLLAAAVLCVLTWRRATGWAPIARHSLLALALLFAFGAGEEVSWGQRVFGVETPDSVAEINRQDELNVHNLELFSGLLDPDRLFQLFWALLGVAIPLAALHGAVRARLVRVVPVLPASLAPVLVLNQVLAWTSTALFEAESGLYRSTTFPLRHAVFETKETGVGLVLGLAFWLLYRSVREGRAAPARD